MIRPLWTKQAIGDARLKFDQEEPERCSTCLAAPPDRGEWIKLHAPHVTIHLCGRCLNYLEEAMGASHAD